MIAVILYILLALFLILILALLLPVKIFLRAAGGDDSEIHANGRVMLFSGLLGVGGSYAPGETKMAVYAGKWKILERNAATVIRKARKRKPAPEKKKPEKPDEKEKKPERKLTLPERIREWRRLAGGYAYLIKTALREVRGLLRVNHFDVRVKFGLGDPALTGQIIGVIYAVNGILPERYVISPAWDFSRRVFSGELDIKLTFRMYLFWIHLARVFLAYLKIRKEQRFVPGDDLKAQEV